MDEINHGSPSPTNTLTELDPVTLPMAESANSNCLAAVILAKVSGREVPIATSVIAVTAGLNPTVQPRTVATSATTAVMVPMNVSATMKAGHPPPHCLGGMKAKSMFQKMQRKCMMASYKVTSSTIRLSSSRVGCKMAASLNCWPHDGFFLATRCVIKLICSYTLSMLPDWLIETTQQFFFEIFTCCDGFSMITLNRSSTSSFSSISSSPSS